MSVSRMRPEIVPARPGEPPAPRGVAAYLVIYNAVQGERGLYYGKLNGPHGEHCAIGSYFAQPKHAPLPSDVIDEVATVNDSVPQGQGMKKRRAVVLKYLRWKLRTLGYPIGGRPGKDLR